MKQVRQRTMPRRNWSLAYILTSLIQICQKTDLETLSSNLGSPPPQYLLARVWVLLWETPYWMNRTSVFQNVSVTALGWQNRFVDDPNVILSWIPSFCMVCRLNSSLLVTTSLDLASPTMTWKRGSMGRKHDWFNLLQPWPPLENHKSVSQLTEGEKSRV